MPAGRQNHPHGTGCFALAITGDHNSQAIWLLGSELVNFVRF